MPVLGLVFWLCVLAFFAIKDEVKRSSRRYTNRKNLRYVSYATEYKAYFEADKELKRIANEYCYPYGYRMKDGRYGDPIPIEGVDQTLSLEEVREGALKVRFDYILKQYSKYPDILPLIKSKWASAEVYHYPVFAGRIKAKSIGRLPSVLDKEAAILDKLPSDMKCYSSRMSPKEFGSHMWSPFNDKTYREYLKLDAEIERDIANHEIWKRM